MEDDVVNEHFDLLTKSRLTIEGILASGRSDIWSTYGALRRAREILYRIFLHGLLAESEEGLLKYLLDSSRKRGGSEDATTFNIDPQDPISLEQFIEEYCLLGFNTSSVVDNSFLAADQKLLSNIYAGSALVRSRPCLLCLKLCFTALEQVSLELLTSLSDILVNKGQFEQYLKEEQNFDPGENEEDEKKVLNSSGTESASFPSFSYSLSSGDEHFPDKQDIDDDSFSRKKSQISMIRNDIKSENPKRRSIHQDVLMASALAAVMETNEDGLIWFDDADRNSLLLEPGEIARNRIARMREISRSESSLFNEHGHVNAAQTIGESKIENEAVTLNESKSGEDRPLDTVTGEGLEPTELKRSRNVISTPFKRGHLRSKSDQIGVSKAVTEDAATEDGAQEDKLSMSAPNATHEENRNQDYYYQPEDGYMFPKPYKGQSLISYLDSRSYDTGVELDKENAHFSICEALITAIEQMRCSKFFDSDSDDSDEEIKSLKKKIKEKKLRKRLMKLEAQRAFSDQSTSTTSKSTSSFFSGSTFSSSPSSSTTEQATQQDSTSQRTLSRSWENVSLSPQQSRTNMKYEAANHAKPEDPKGEESEPKPEQKPDDYSAEVVAKSLLKKFAGRKLPAASDLKWIVSEDQVPQAILPLPNAWPVSPDDALFNGANFNDDDVDSVKNLRKPSAPTRLRGNFEWAPPRPQLIFTAHPYTKRKVMLQKQHYRCAGCGLKVTPSLSKRFRYCHYLGKYFCTSCHQNRMISVPSKIIDKWDFKHYPISDFAREFLNKIWRDPLFNLSAIDNNIYKKIKGVEFTRELRLKLHYAKGFLKTCRHADSLYNEMQKLPQHLVDEIHLYSLEDFVQVKNGDLPVLLRSLVTSSLKHIKDCQLCAVKGFMCEYCRDFDDILYPFELNKVATCPHCKTCYHKTCFVPEKCPKCLRVRARQRLLDAKNLDNLQ